jgi:hypothetical protein
MKYATATKRYIYCIYTFKDFFLLVSILLLFKAILEF